MLSRLFRRAPQVADAYPLYAGAVAQARQPVFYARLGVPDTVDGRFDLVALHIFLILQRLKAEPDAAPFAQAVFDAMFADMDRNLREMGVGDLSVGKKVKAMAQGLYGRIAAYEAGLAAGEEALRAGVAAQSLRHPGARCRPLRGRSGGHGGLSAHLLARPGGPASGGAGAGAGGLCPPPGARPIAQD